MNFLRSVCVFTCKLKIIIKKFEKNEAIKYLHFEEREEQQSAEFAC